MVLDNNRGAMFSFRIFDSILYGDSKKIMSQYISVGFRPFYWEYNNVFMI